MSQLSTFSAQKKPNGTNNHHNSTLLQKYSVPSSAIKHTVRHLALDLSGYKPQ
jgi:hypothetical protein